MSHKPKKEDEIPVALALFEPPDPTKKPMYCKHLVYQGVTEFQFEELRAARYRQKVAREEVNQVITMIYNCWLKFLIFFARVKVTKIQIIISSLQLSLKNSGSKLLME